MRRFLEFRHNRADAHARKMKRIVTVARALSDTFAGIVRLGVIPFIGAQLVGMLATIALGRWLWRV